MRRGRWLASGPAIFFASPLSRVSVRGLVRFDQRREAFDAALSRKTLALGWR